MNWLEAMIFNLLNEADLSADHVVTQWPCPRSKLVETAPVKGCWSIKVSKRNGYMILYIIYIHII